MGKWRKQLVDFYEAGIHIQDGVQTIWHPSRLVTSIENQAISSGHPYRNRRRNREGLTDLGGPFLLYSVKPDLGSAKVSAKATVAGINHEYRGWMGARWADYEASKSGFLSAKTNGQLNALGTTGIAKASPTNPLSGMGQFLAELRDVPAQYNPKGWKDIAHRFKKTPAKEFANRYLEYEFGWLPFVKDINDFFKVAGSLTDRALQFERDSGKTVRRKRKIFENITNTSTVKSNAWYGATSMPSYMYTSPGILTEDVQTFERAWFSGAFTYYVPPIYESEFLGDFRHYASVTNHLFGTRLDPGLLWDLAPWSWAVDWVSNTGDIIHNWSNFRNDGLVMRYAYVMYSLYQTTTWNVKDLRLKGMSEPLNLTDRVITSVKQRARATPYGFGLSLDSFSNKQLAVMGALGIQRA